MSAFHKLVKQEELLLRSSGYAQVVMETSFLQSLKYQLNIAMYDAQKQNRPQSFKLPVDTERDQGRLFMMFNYQYDPEKAVLKVNAIDAHLGDTARRFIPLVENRIPGPDAIAAYLSNPNKIKPTKWAKEYKAKPMDLQPGTHKKRRAL